MHRLPPRFEPASHLALSTCVCAFASALESDELGALSRIAARNLFPSDAERFIAEVRGDDPEAAEKLRIEERELETGGMN